MKASKFIGGADRVRFEAGRGWHGGGGGLPQGRDQRGDVLQLAEEVCRADALGDEAAAAARGRERKLKRIVADLSLDKAMLQDVLVKKALRPARKRELVDEVRSDWKVSIRRACSTLRIDRALYVYKSKRGDQADLKQRIKEICETRVRYGYRRIHVLLRREGWAVNVKRVYRLYRELGLQLRNKTPKRRVKAKLRDDRQCSVRSTRPGRWTSSMTSWRPAARSGCSRSSTPSPGSRQRVDPRFSYRGEDVVQTLERICNEASAIPRRSASIRAPSSSRAISISGPTSGVSCSTSRGRASRPTTASSNPSTASSERSA